MPGTRRTSAPRRRLAVALALALALLAVRVPSAGGQSSTPTAASLLVTPSVDLLAGQLVTVSGSGFPPGALVVIVQCLAGAGQEGCDLTRQTLVTADGSGGFTTGVGVSRLLHVDGTTDCATPGACVLGAGVPPDGALGNATAAIRFDPDAPVPAPPAIEVTPSTGLVDGQVVTITGRGFPPGAGLFFVQCLTSGAGQEGCDLTSQAFGLADASGAVTTTIRVARTLVTPQGTVDCAAPGTCMIGGGVPPDGAAGAATAPIAFAADATAPTTSVPSPSTDDRVAPRFAG